MEVDKNLLNDLYQDLKDKTIKENIALIPVEPEITTDKLKSNLFKNSFIFLFYNICGKQY